MTLKQTAIRAAQAAGKILLEDFYKKRKILEFKSKHDISVPADLKAEKIILNIIRKKYPNHQILSEESGRLGKKSDYLWIVDPLDGTTNYYMGNPMFCTSLALVYKHELILGVIYAPYLKELYLTEKNKGAYLNKKRIKVSKQNRLSKSLLTFCHGNKEEDIRRLTRLYKKFKISGFDMRQLGSAGLELGFVARGSTEAIMIPGAHVWDVASGVLLVRETGGKVTDFKNNQWNLKSKDMLASNSFIHNQLIKIISKI